MRNNKKKKTLGQIIRRWILMILLLLVGLVVILAISSQRVEVTDRAMSPTLEEGDTLAVDHLRLKFFNPRRYDVIIFPSRYESNVSYIRRIIGLPGETVRIVDGQVYINGVILSSDRYGDEPISLPGAAYGTITLGADEYFVLGDHRNASTDSREPSIGNIRRDEIEGVIMARIWPFLRIGLV